MGFDGLPAVRTLGFEFETLGNALFAIKFGTMRAEGGVGRFAVTDLASQELLKMETLLYFMSGSF